MRNTNPEIQSMRDQLANEIREIRKKGDSAREDGHRKGSYEQARYRLGEGKKEILEKQEELARLEFQQKYQTVIDGLAFVKDIYEQLPYSLLHDDSDDEKVADLFFKMKHEVIPLLAENPEILNQTKQFLSPNEYTNLLTVLNQSIFRATDFKASKEETGKPGFAGDAFYLCAEQIRQSGLAIIENHLDVFAQQIGLIDVGFSPEDSFLFLNSVRLFIEHGSAKQRSAGYAVLEQKIKNLFNGVMQESPVVANRTEYGCKYLITKLYESTQDETTKMRIEYALKRLYYGENDLFRRNALDIICGLSLKNSLEIVRSILEHWDLDADKVLESWGEISNTISYNLEKVYNLEQQQPGIAKFLLKEFGIRHFGRYPRELLQEQYKQFNNQEIPYGLVLYAVDDWNNAFQSQIGVLENLYKQIKDKYTLRIVECNSKIDIARSLIKLDRQYGEEHKIDFLIVCAHGNPDAIFFGKPTFHRQFGFSIEDLLGQGVRHCSKFLSSNAPIILNSCSTGQEQGIAQKLSQTWNREVIAPDNDSSVDTIQVKDIDGKLEFLVKYRGANTMNYQSNNIDKK